MLLRRTSPLAVVAVLVLLAPATGHASSFSPDPPPGASELRPDPAPSSPSGAQLSPPAPARTVVTLLRCAGARCDDAGDGSAPGRSQSAPRSSPRRPAERRLPHTDRLALPKLELPPDRRPRVRLVAASASLGGRARRARTRARRAHGRLGGRARSRLEQTLMRSTAALLAIGLALIVARASRRGRPRRVVHRDRRHDGRQRVVPQRRHRAAVRARCDRLHCPLVKTFRTSSDAVDCTATDGSSTVQFHLQFKIDTDAPAVTTASPDRAPDAGGWYSHPVIVTFSGNDTTSGIASCTTASYSGPRLWLGDGHRDLSRQRGQCQLHGLVRTAL